MRVSSDKRCQGNSPLDFTPSIVASFGLAAKGRKARTKVAEAPNALAMLPMSSILTDASSIGSCKQEHVGRVSDIRSGMVRKPHPKRGDCLGQVSPNGQPLSCLPSVVASQPPFFAPVAPLNLPRGLPLGSSVKGFPPSALPSRRQFSIPLQGPLDLPAVLSNRQLEALPLHPSRQHSVSCTFPLKPSSINLRQAHWMMQQVHH